MEAAKKSLSTARPQGVKDRRLLPKADKPPSKRATTREATADENDDTDDIQAGPPTKRSRKNNATSLSMMTQEGTRASGNDVGFCGSQFEGNGRSLRPRAERSAFSSASLDIPSQDTPLQSTFSDPNHPTSHDQSNVDHQDSAKMAKAASSTAITSSYPPLPTISNDAWTDYDTSALEQDATGSNPYQNLVNAAQAALAQQGVTLPSTGAPDTIPPSSSAPSVATPATAVLPVIFRQVPRDLNASQRVSDERVEYENKVRTEEGHFRHSLHRRVMLETSLDSWRARKVANNREDSIFTAVKADLVAAVPNMAGDFFPGALNKNEPIRNRLFKMYFATLVTQYGDSWETAKATQESSLEDECELEARRWTIEKLQEMDVENRDWISNNDHLRTERQSHLEFSR